MVAKPDVDTQSLGSAFRPDANFEVHRTLKQEARFAKLEWRAQFQNVDQIVEKRRSARMQERLKRRDKSSDAHFVHSEFIKTIHSRGNQEELPGLLQLSCWEKIGFTNQSKR